MSKPARPLVVSAKEIEIRAEVIDPAASVFLSANAGSGKTTILTNRVIRLMLDGAEPAKILCLTYTKAAAAEMANRIFGDLAGWVRLDDADLAAKISGLTGRRAGDADLARARALFARAVETPGGLKIQTIHAFAERLLHLFPFEANVPARFSVMDDVGKSELLEKAKRATIRAALDAPESMLGGAFKVLANLVAEDGFDALMHAALPMLRKARAGAVDPADWRVQLAGTLGLDPSETEEKAALAVLDCGFPPGKWRDALAEIEALGPHKASSTEGHFVAKLALCLAASDTITRADALIALFSTDKGEPRKTMLTKPVQTKMPWLAGPVNDAMAALPTLVERLKRVRTLERSVVLMIVSDAILGRFRAEKQRRALVDFDDMIDRALELVTRQNGASWVLMKLDGGIDHVLIDEAQDTTPEMWQIARALTDEFFDGAGARPGNRTVFAVGDDKQSIYSFQGASPQAFEDNRRLFERKAEKIEARFLERKLQLSFRTVVDVLSAVDAVFSEPARYRGLTALPEATVHQTARVGDPGFVEIWPLEPPPAKDERDAWEPVDSLGEGSAEVRLARRLAAHIAGLIANERYDNDGAAIRAGDIMILVQRRNAFFEAVIRALKQAGVPVAGADRLRLTREIAVMDLIAAARVALLPQDDLALAEALKSPLIGLTDDDLIALAPRRTGSLLAALEASEAPAHRSARANVGMWQDLAARETPYGFFSTILGPMGGRKALLARLGPDAADGIENFLAGVLDREAREPPSLVGEIAAFESLDTDIKRDQDHAGSAVRVMTVHGAKGLEARIVYLPDCQRVPDGKKDGAIFAADDENDPARRVLLWAPRKEDRPAAFEERRAADEIARMNEYRRLFYVAMTRARDRLYLAGWGDFDKVTKSGECWYAMAHAALAEGAETIARADGAEILRWRKTPVVEMPAASADVVAAPVDGTLPGWIGEPAPSEPTVLPPLRPSRAIDAADQVISPERDLARQRGDLAHLLLERLPEIAADARRDAATRLLATRAPRLSPDERDRMVAQAIRLIEAPAFAELFGSAARAEVALTGDITLPNGQIRSVLGRIDRLVVNADRVIVADFKTGRGPARPRELTQLALYRALLAVIYPGRAIDCVLVFTEAFRAETIDVAALDRAFSQL